MCIISVDTFVCVCERERERDLEGEKPVCGS